MEVATKPAVLALLIAGALTLEPASPDQRGAFAGALLLSLSGDVALLAPGRRWFAFGLGAFLLAHGTYVIGLLLEPDAGGSPLVGLVLAGAGAALVGVTIVRATRRHHGRAEALAVAAYVVAISATVVAATASGDVLAAAGAAALYASDGILGWNRFVHPIPAGRLLTRIPYHIGQALMVVSLLA